MIFLGGPVFIIEEKFHLKEAICTGLSLVVGVISLFGGLFSIFSGEDIISSLFIFVSGLGLASVSILSFRITSGWKYANNLSTGKKIVAYIPVIMTGVIFIIMLIVMWAMKEALRDSLRQR